MSLAPVSSDSRLGNAMGAERVTLLGVRFNRLSRTAALSALESTLGREEARKVFIVNAHTLNLAWTDPGFRRVLNDADLLLNDGTGVQFASYLAGEPFPDNLVGTDLVPEFCHHAAARDAGVFLLGGQPGVGERAAKRLRALIPGLRICGTHHGYFPGSQEAGVLHAINRSGAAILLVAFGNPLQEIWIDRNSDRLRCDVCIGIGGLIDHLSGRLRRAPAWVRKARMEWIHILWGQPHKWRRYVLGNPQFISRALKSRLGWGP